MTCKLPPELSEEQLLAYLAGEGDPDIEAHLQACSYCMERARQLELVEAGLQANLYRVDCPSPEVLGDYHLKLLPHLESRDVGRHLGQCPHCAQELELLRTYLKDIGADLEPRPLEGLRVLVARLAGAAGLAGGPQLAPAVVGLRGGDSAPALYEADGVQISVEVQDDSSQPGRKVLTGLVLGGGQPDFTARLILEREEKDTQGVDDLGNFMFTGLQPGVYDLILQGPDTEIHLTNLTI